MEKDELRKLQLYQLDILKEVNRICEKYSIKYYISWGTLLGAVRHKGFIPWDDDIDISMFWDDYLRFCEVCRQELDEKLFLQNISTDKEYFRPWSKLRINNTTSMDRQLDYMNMHWGICIDIFPIIKVPSDKKSRIIQKLLINVYKILCFEPLVISTFNNNNNLKIYEKLILAIPTIIFSVIPTSLKQSMKKMLIKKITKKPKKSSEICGEVLSMGYEKAVVPESMYGEPQKLEFEGYEFNAPNQYIEYLTNFYGDYMKLPPESERNGHGDTVISFDFQANKK